MLMEILLKSVEISLVFRCKSRAVDWFKSKSYQIVARQLFMILFL